MQRNATLTSLFSYDKIATLDLGSEKTPEEWQGS